MLDLYVRLMDRIEEQKGQGLVEYALIIVLVGLLAMVGLEALGTQLDSTLDRIVTEITPAAG